MYVTIFFAIFVAYFFVIDFCCVFFVTYFLLHCAHLEGREPSLKNFGNACKPGFSVEANFKKCKKKQHREIKEAASSRT